MQSTLLYRRVNDLKRASRGRQKERQKETMQSDTRERKVQGTDGGVLPLFQVQWPWGEFGWLRADPRMLVVSDGLGRRAASEAATGESVTQKCRRSGSRVSVSYG